MTGTARGSRSNRCAGSWLLLAALGALAAGTALLVTAGLMLSGAPAVPRGPAPAPSADPPSVSMTPSPPTAVPDATTSPEPGRTGITAMVDLDWADAVAGELGIPRPAFRAYAGASFAVAEEYPECGLGWNTLAGIGLVESHHGTIGGAKLDAEGRASPPIVGIALDGTRSGRVRDTDRGELDGDTTWDRAVGPMQFIPSTWRTWGSDGNGDGVADPQQIDDAAYSAARYLCAMGGNLREPRNWIAAVTAYNNSVEYNNRVADAADHYALRAETALP